MIKKTSLFIGFLLLFQAIFTQQPEKLTSNQIFEQLQKLNFIGSALYVAAHPDDENTRLISYLSNHVKARTAYLSLTRGDGGQNLIGPELRELLGVIRTQELLAARKVDGGQQLFTRANDFGYSKHPDETLEIWNKKEVLADVVWAIRTFKPDVIINRFNHRTPGTTHGHHTSSAMLSYEAFDLAGRKNEFKEQLNYTETWQPKRLYFNTSWWFYGSQDRFKEATKGNDKFASFDVGVYYPLKGLSNNEVAAIASSQHLCQGFGRLTSRGSQKEYIEFLKGDQPKNPNDIFSGINTTWNRLKNGGEIGEILYEIENNFDFVNPSSHLPDLLKAYQKIQLLEDDHWRTIKENQILTIIQACAGLYLEATARTASTTLNGTVAINFEVLNRSDLDARLKSVTILPSNTWINKNEDLIANQRLNFSETISVNANQDTAPYWLNDKATLGMYHVENQELIGKPETPRYLKVAFLMTLNNQEIRFVKDVVYRYAERDKGEIYEPFEVLPKFTTKLKDKVIIFADDKPKKISVAVQSGAENVSGRVRLTVPNGWTVSPKSTMVTIAQKNDKKTIEFLVTPSKEESEGKLEAMITSDGKIYRQELVTINYDHIPKQSVLLPSTAKVVRLNIQKAGNYIGYIKGAGDAVPESLSQIGYNVVAINPNEINKENLHKFDAVVLGIRAYNVVKELQFKQPFLLDYVQKGGNLIVQYNTSRNVNVGAPYDLKLSRDRVTDENAKVTLLAKNHSLLNFPNKLKSSDFDNWVQERGLYFPNSWSKEYTPILSMNDKGETPKQGSLLIAKYGKGNYIYTGLSLFRELPAGVPGAYKLLANMLSVGKENIKTTATIKR